MVPPCAPAAVGTPVRNAVAPVPIAKMVAPLGAMPTLSAAVVHQLDRRCGPEFSSGRFDRRLGSRLHRRGREGQPAQECNDRRAHFSLHRERGGTAEARWLTEPIAAAPRRWV